MLFYQALWLEAGPDGRAAVGLGVLAWLILKVGLRLPLGWFFGVGSILMALVAVVLAGKGIAAFQEAGALPVRPLDLPAIPSLGLYPTWQGVLTQLAVVLLIAAAFAYSRRASSPRGWPSRRRGCRARRDRPGPCPGRPRAPPAA